jgi:cardiolipin synthase A/B
MARQDHWLHSKSIVVDTLFSMIGSSNLDVHSAEINEELDVVVYDRDFSRQMEEIFTNDLERTREYTLEQFRNRSLWERAVNGLPTLSARSCNAISAFSR